MILKIPTNIYLFKAAAEETLERGLKYVQK